MHFILIYTKQALKGHCPIVCKCSIKANDGDGARRHEHDQISIRPRIVGRGEGDRKVTLGEEFVGLLLVQPLEAQCA